MVIIMEKVNNSLTVAQVPHTIMFVFSVCANSGYQIAFPLQMWFCCEATKIQQIWIRVRVKVNRISGAICSN